MQLTDVERFQSNPLNLNHLGLRLDVDNVIGPETRWAMNVASLSVERRTVIREAQKSRGLKESPPRSNSDPTGTIERWLKASHARPGDPWCAAAASEWLSSVIPVRVAGAVRLGQRFPATTTPWAGDIGWYPTDDKGHGHVFLILGVGSTEVMTWEGNLDNEARCARRPRAGLNFSRTFDETLGTCPRVILTVPLAGGGTR